MKKLYLLATLFTLVHQATWTMEGEQEDLNQTHQELIKITSSSIKEAIKYNGRFEEILKSTDPSKLATLLDMQDESGKTALMYATEQNNWPFVKSLILAGANTMLKDNNGKTALDFAKNGTFTYNAIKAAQEDALVSQAQLSKKDDIEKLDNQLKTILGRLIALAPSQKLDQLNQALEEATQLIEQGANPNIKDENNYTTLMWAIFQDHPDKVERILSSIKQSLSEKLKRTLHQKDIVGRTPLELAKIGNNEVVIQMLKDAGAEY